MDGNTYTVTAPPTVGSKGTETNAFQMLMGSKVTFKNGTVKVASDSTAAILFQNYCDFTLNDVTVDITECSNTGYAVSNNFGSLTVKGNTTINAGSTGVAFDLWYGMDKNGAYDEGVTVTFDSGFAGSVTGKIEYGADTRAASMSWKEKTKLIIAGSGKFNVSFVDSNSKDNVTAESFNISITGGTFNFDPSAYMDSSCVAVNDSTAGTWTVRARTEDEAVASVKYSNSEIAYYNSILNALDAASNGSTVTLIKDDTVRLNDTGSQSGYDTSLWFDTPNITLDLNGKTLTTISNNGGSCNVLNVIAPGWTIKNGSIVVKKTDGSYDSYTLGVENQYNKDENVYRWDKVDLTLENVSLTGGVAAYGAGTTVTLNGVTSVMATNYYCAYAEGGAQVVVDGGSYKWNTTAEVEENERRPIFYAADKSSIKVNGGSFDGNIIWTKGTGSISVTGGTFSTDPSDYVAGKNYIVCVNNDDTYTVVSNSNLISGTYKGAVPKTASGYSYTNDGGDTYTVYKIYVAPSDTTTKTETTTNRDGSTTKTETKSDGTVVETTTSTDGTKTVVESKTTTDSKGTKTETVTETVTAKDGSKTEIKTEVKTAKDGTTTSTEVAKVTDSTGSTGTTKTETNAAGETTVKAEATVSTKAVEEAQKENKAVTVPVEVKATTSAETAPVVSVSVPKSAGEVKVEVPVTNTSSGTVAVLVHADGTEEIVKTCTNGENGVVLSVSGDVTVKIVDNSKTFADTTSHWSKDEVNFVASREIFNGVGNNDFGVSAPMTRGMVNTVLARLSGANTDGGETWYTKGNEWAIANGVSDGTNPTGNVTREQLATMLYRYAGSPAVTGTLSFTDAGSVSDYAQTALLWASQIGIIGGMGDGSVAPTAGAERAQVAAMLARYIKLVG